MDQIAMNMHFSEDPQLCARQLADHPYMRSAKERPQQQWEDPYRPHFHFSCPEGQ